MKRAVNEAAKMDSMPKSRTFHRCMMYSRGPSLQISLHSDQIIPTASTHTHIRRAKQIIHACRQPAQVHKHPYHIAHFNTSQTGWRLENWSGTGVNCLCVHVPVTMLLWGPNSFFNQVRTLGLVPLFHTTLALGFIMKAEVWR